MPALLGDFNHRRFLESVLVFWCTVFLWPLEFNGVGSAGTVGWSIIIHATSSKLCSPQISRWHDAIAFKRSQIFCWHALSRKLNDLSFQLDLISRDFGGKWKFDDDVRNVNASCSRGQNPTYELRKLFSHWFNWPILLFQVIKWASLVMVFYAQQALQNRLTGARQKIELWS